MEVTTIGIDLAKNVFAVCGADSSGRVLMRRQLRRAQVLSFMRGLPRCVVGMEASGGGLVPERGELERSEFEMSVPII